MAEVMVLAKVQGEVKVMNIVHGVQAAEQVMGVWELQVRTATQGEEDLHLEE